MRLACTGSSAYCTQTNFVSYSFLTQLITFFTFSSSSSPGSFSPLPQLIWWACACVLLAPDMHLCFAFFFSISKWTSTKTIMMMMMVLGDSHDDHLSRLLARESKFSMPTVFFVSFLFSSMCLILILILLLKLSKYGQWRAKNQWAHYENGQWGAVIGQQQQPSANQMRECEGKCKGLFCLFPGP